MGVALTELLELKQGDVLSLVGCGDFMALTHILAEENNKKRLLVSTTTEMTPMREDEAVVCCSLLQCISHKPQTGTQFLGILNPETGKMEALPEKILRTCVRGYQLTILHTDQWDGMPCRGWQETEQTPPAFTAVTVGLVTLGGLDRPATREAVGNLPEFLRLTGLQAGENIGLPALTEMICGEEGMFRNAVGKLCLVVDLPEERNQAALAHAWLESLEARQPGRFGSLIVGSIAAGQWERV